MLDCGVRSAHAITHVAVCNALGRTTAAVQEALFAGRSGLRREQPFADVFPVPFATSLGRTDIAPGDPWLVHSHEPRQHALCLLAFNDLLAPFRAAVNRVGPERAAIILGTSTGGIEASERAFAARLATGSLPAGYDFDRDHAFDSSARLIAASVGARGPIYAISTACSSSAKALAAAGRLLDGGLADAVLVLGVDSLCRTTLLGFHGLGVVDPGGCRPFAADRRGMTVAEGAAALLLERDRAAEAYLVGCGETSDAHHMAQPHPEGEGAAQAIEDALDDAGIAPSAIDHVNAHGTATPANDAVEAAVLARRFGSAPLVSSTKTHTGHLLGASGATEAAFCVEAIRQQRVPGNGDHTVASDFGITIPARSVARRVDFALSNSFAFGGSNAALVFASEAGRARLGEAEHAAPRRIRRIEWLELAAVCSTPHAGTHVPSLLAARALGRASPLTRTFANLLSELAVRGVDASRVPLVFASAFGEMRTTLELLQLQAEKGESSPLRFQVSVHNAAQGLLSIATGHRGFATSLSAGPDTFAMALVEATGVLSNGHDEVVVLVAEEQPRPELSAAEYPALGVGLHLRASARSTAAHITPPFRAVVDASELASLPNHAGSQSPVGDYPRLLAAHARRAPARVPLGTSPRVTAGETRWVIDYRPAPAPD